MSRDKSGIARGNGVVEGTDRAVPFYVGPSKIKHSFDPHNEADRRAAMLGARSPYGQLPSGIVVSTTAENSLCFTAKGKSFVILTDQPWAYANMRRSLHEHLKQSRNHESKDSLFTEIRPPSQFS